MQMSIGCLSVMERGQPAQYSLHLRTQSSLLYERCAAQRTRHPVSQGPSLETTFFFCCVTGFLGEVMKGGLGSRKGGWLPSKRERSRGGTSSGKWAIRNGP